MRELSALAAGMDTEFSPSAEGAEGTERLDDDMMSSRSSVL